MESRFVGAMRAGEPEELAKAGPDAEEAAGGCGRGIVCSSGMGFFI